MFLLLLMFRLLMLPSFASALPEGVTEWNETTLPLLDETFSKAKIVGLGEGAHGSSAYATSQFVIVKYAVETHGYRRILQEMLSDDRELGEYVRSCKGNLREILYKNAWHENTAEREEFYQWLCRFNREHRHDPVEVFSVDAQSPWVDVPSIRKFLHAYDEAIEKTFLPAIQNNCFGAANDSQLEWAFSSETSEYFKNKALPKDKHEACMAQVDGLLRLMHSSSDRMIEKTGELVFFDAENALQSLRAWQIKSFLMFSDEPQALAVRENAFFNNTLWKWRRNNPVLRPAIFIAHNLHIAAERLLAVNPDDPWQGLKSVGNRLHDVLEHEYAAIALSGYNVAGLFSGQYPLPVSDDSIDLLLHGLGKPQLLLQTGAPWIGDRPHWHLHEERAVNGRPYALAHAFDFILFHEVSASSAFLGNPRH